MRWRGAQRAGSTPVREGLALPPMAKPHRRRVAILCVLEAVVKDAFGSVVFRKKPHEVRATWARCVAHFHRAVLPFAVFKPGATALDLPLAPSATLHARFSRLSAFA